MSKSVTLTIDDQEVTVPEGTFIVEAAKKIGIHIPVFCSHPKLEPVGMCRMCLVDIGRPVFDREIREQVIELPKTDQARVVGKVVAERTIAKVIKKVVFDRGGYKYHGRVKALAEAARKAGLEF